MISQEKSDALQAIAALSERFPEWRLGQLVSNVAGWHDREVWDLEDRELLAAVQEFFQTLGPLKYVGEPHNEPQAVDR